MAFGDFTAAAKARDIIEQIAGSVVNRERPDIRVGKVYSTDEVNQVAKILMPGETDFSNLITVRFALDKIPSNLMIQDDIVTIDSPGDIVRIAGKTGSLFILDYMFGAPKIQIPVSLDYSTLHPNPDFELIDGSIPSHPTNWNYFFQVGGCLGITDNAVYYTGNKSLAMIINAGHGNFIQETSDTFAVNPGDLVTLKFVAKSDNGLGGINPFMMTAASGTPAQFDPGTTNVNPVGGSVVYTITTDWLLYTVSFSIPAAQTRARFVLSGRSPTDAASRVNVDSTNSSKVAGSTDTNWITLPYLNGWTAYGSGNRAPAYQRVNGKVECRGLVKYNGGPSGIFAGLPSGFRPLETEAFIQMGVNGSNVESFIHVNANTDGTLQVTANGPTTGQWVSLSNIRFQADGS